MSPVRMDVAFGRDETRDLGSLELWERSLKRSRHRRRIAEINRRSRRRRKGTSVAVTAAMAAGPVLPTATAVADSGSVAGSANQIDPGAHDALSGSARHVVLRYGSTGRLVAAAQMRLNAVVPVHHLAVDGIYGPLTRAAVEDFQARHSLGASGAIDTRTWADMFNAPVLALASGDSGSGSKAGDSVEVSTRSAPAGKPRPQPTSAAATAPRPAAVGSADAGTPQTASSGSTGSSNGSSGGGNAPVAVVTPAKPTSQSVAYVLSNGVALPLPRGYLTGGSVDQGVDYAAPGGTPLYAMGDGVIIGAGISGFGPNAPILKITSGPLKGMEIYYGHAGANSVRVGQRVRAGQQISQVGYGIVGISTGPHLEVGFYPPGPMGSGSRMLSLINSLLHQHSSGRVWGAKTARAATVRTAAARASAGRSTTSTHASNVAVSRTVTPSASAARASRASAVSSTGDSAPAEAMSTTTATAAATPRRPAPQTTMSTSHAAAPAEAAKPAAHADAPAPAAAAPSSAPAPAASSAPSNPAPPSQAPSSPAPPSQAPPSQAPSSPAPSSPAPTSSDSGASVSSADTSTTATETTTSSTDAATSSADAPTASSTAQTATPTDTTSTATDTTTTASDTATTVSDTATTATDSASTTGG